MLRTTVIPDRAASPATTLCDAPGRVWAGLRATIAARARTWIARRDARLLMEMPDYLLKDIGIGRSQISSAVRQGRA